MYAGSPSSTPPKPVPRPSLLCRVAIIVFIGIAPPAPPSAAAARAFLFSRLDGGSHRRLSGSNRTSQARSAPPSPRLPTRNTRRRRWATPKNCASRTRHARQYPRSSISVRSCPKAAPPSLDSAPGTFSQTNQRGRSSRTHRMYSNMSPDAPASPSRFPATEKDWQGLPPTTRSTDPISLQSTFVISPRFGTSGNRSASTALGNGSISLNATGSHPSWCHARVAASTPLNTDTYLTPPPPRPRAPSRGG